MKVTETPQEGAIDAAPVVESTAVQKPLTPQEIASNRYLEVKAQIAKYTADYMGLKINGPEDKKGFDLVNKAKNIVVKTRTNSTRINTEANAPLKEQIKLNNAALEDAIKGLLPIEKHLKTEEEAYNSAVKTAEANRLAELRERMEERIEELRELGFGFNRMMKAYWVRLNDQDIMVGMDDLEKWDDTDFNNFYDETSVLYQANETRKQQEADEAQKQRDALDKERQKLEEDRQALELEKATARQNQPVTPKPVAVPVQIDRVETPPLQIDQVPVTPVAAVEPAAIDVNVGPSDTQGALRHIEEQREQPAAIEPVVETVVETAPVAAVEPAAIEVDDHTDKQKFLTLADQIAALEIPTCDTFEGGLLVDVVADHVAALISLIRNQANAL